MRPRFKLFLLLALLSLVLYSASAAGEKGWFGLGVKVEGDSFSFNPTLEKITVTKVMPSSPAAAAGLTAGDLLVEIQGLPIPGAKARDLKAAMNQSVGASLRLKVKHGDGEPRAITLVAVAKP